GLRREAAVLVRGLVTDLPGPVQLVAEAPGADVVRLLGAVGTPKVGELGAPRVVAVLHEVDGLRYPASAEIHSQDGINLRAPAPGGEVVHPHGVGPDPP